jgi:hypothetical protein
MARDWLIQYGTHQAGPHNAYRQALLVVLLYQLLCQVFAEGVVVGEAPALAKSSCTHVSCCWRQGHDVLVQGQAAEDAV